MRIVYCTDQISSHGGVGRVLATKANYFSKLGGYEVFILTTEQKGQPFVYALNENVRHTDLMINYHRGRSYLHPMNIRKGFVHYVKLKRALHAIRPDAIIICNDAYDFYFLPFAKKKAVLIREFHGSFFTESKKVKSFFQRCLYEIEGWIEKRYDALAVLTSDEKRHFRSDNVVVLPNPIELTDKTAPLENKKAVAVGRLAPVKGFDRLVAAWSQFSKQHPDWELHIYGEDYLGTKATLERQIEDWGLQNQVFLKGASSDMRQTMLDYSMLLVSSYVEAFSMVTVEAQALGIPVIAYDVPYGPRNIITSGEDGILVEDGDQEAFVDAVVSLTDRAERLRMGKNAKLNVRRFAVEDVMTKWVEVVLKR